MAAWDIQRRARKVSEMKSGPVYIVYLSNAEFLTTVKRDREYRRDEV
jgi:hypothetical protein